MPRKKAAAKSEAEETTEVLDTKEPERPMSPNEGPAEIGQAGDEASCAGVLEPAGEEEPYAEAAVSQQDMSVADMLLPEENADCALPGFVDSKNEEKTERNAGYLVVSQSGGGMLRQGTREGIRRTPANRGMRAHRIVKGLDISEDVCHGMCP